jgi:hypothetical protein
MGTGAKIAIGCGVAVLVTGIAAVVGVVGLGMWGKSKLDAFAAEQKAVEELEKKADANPFTVPEDGVIQEARLLKFIEARQRVHPVYETYRAEFEGLQNVEKKKEPDFSDIGKAVKAGAGFLELRKVQLQALADLGMSREEYRYLVQAVYQSWWASEIEKSTGKTLAENKEAAQDSMKEAARQLEEQSKAPIDPNLPPEAQKAMREAQEQMRQSQRQIEHSSDHVDQQTAGLDIPPQNIALFRKYEADIKKYAMTGLEALTF